MAQQNTNINIIIPAYNESKNIAAVIDGIRKVLPDVGIIIVDDSGTIENKKTKKAISTYKNVEIISRGKKIGRGSAVLEGFRHSLKNQEIQYFFEIDADLAHDPTHLKSFISKISKGKKSMVIGSRYVRGGKIVGSSLKRRILSKTINKFLSVMLNVKLSDYTSGFRLYKRDAVEFLVNAKLKSTGFITLSEITYKLNKNGFKIGEVPATISQRVYGKSTMGFHELKDSLFFIIRMKFEEEFLGKFKF